jgi:HEAT repeat protein
LNALRRALTNSDLNLATVAARGLMLRKDQGAAATFALLLEHEAPPVRLAAAEALAHCGNRECLPQIWRSLAASPDRFLEHALIHAAQRLADVDALVSALNDPSTRVQRAALLLLSQPPATPAP